MAENSGSGVVVIGNDMKCDVDESFSKMLADAIEGVLVVSETVQSTKGGGKSATRANTNSNKTKVGGVDATVGDITAQVILAIQPIFIKTVTSAVTAAVSAAFRHLKDEIQGIEIVKEELKAVKEELRAAKTNMQINRFEIDRLEQYSRRDSVRVCGIAETDNENTNDIVVRVAKDMGVVISPNDISVSHRVGGPRRGRTSDKPRPILAKFVRREFKSQIMYRKKNLREVEAYRNVYVQEDLTKARSKLVFELKRASDVKRVWTVNGRIVCLIDINGHEAKKVVETPDDLFHLGWSEERVMSLGLYVD